MRKTHRRLLEDAAPGEDLYGLERMSKKSRQALDSVDDQIDGKLLQFETDSIKNSSEDEIMLESLQNLNMMFLLEAEGDDSAAAKKDAEAPASSADTKEKPETVDKKPPLDIDVFTRKVVRLIMNYKDLLRIEPVIVNRAAAFLEKNYGKDYVDEMTDILDTEFDFNLEGEEDVGEVPIAAGAGVKTAGA